jgi:hypothetical protein
MSSLRRLNRLEFLRAAAAGAGAGTGAFVQISGAQQKPAAKSQYISAARRALGSRISPLFRSRGCQGGEIHECGLIGRDCISAPLWSLCLERTAAGSDRGGDCIEPGYPAVELSLTCGSMALELVRMFALPVSVRWIV